jgi:membrane protease YdiL (CAAX protease family)
VNKDLIALCWLVAIAVPGVLALTLKGNGKRLAGNVLLAVLSVFVASFMWLMITSPDKLAKATAKLAADQAELALRIQACTSAAQSHMFSQILSAAGEKQPENKSAVASGLDKSYETAQKALANAVAQYPKDLLLKAKLAVLLATRANDGDRELAAKEAMELLKEAQAAKSSTGQQLGETLLKIYSEGGMPVAAQSLNAMEKVLKDEIPPGWYRDNALNQLYLKQNDRDKLDSQNKLVEEKYWRMFVKFAGLLSIALPAFLVGVIVILIQMGLASRQRQQLADEVGIDVPVKSAYIVFVGWFATEVAASYLAAKATLGLHLSQTDPLSLATMTTIGYLLSNGPGLFYLYWFAIRPQSFVESMRLTGRTTTAGPFKLVLFGYLSWCCMLPLVSLSGWIASHYFGTQGSDNPVIAQLVQAAGSPNWFATLLFYFALGVLAPICEETLFRGFLYSLLKRRLGVVAAVTLSAALFAVLHFDRGGILMLFTIGCVLAYTFERTRSLLPCMIAHGLWNSGSFSMALILFGTN